MDSSNNITKRLILYLKIILPIAAIVGLFVFKNYFLDKVSNSLAVANHQGEAAHFAEYDFSDSSKKIRGTLLEFGATNCSACRRMEKVLAEIKTAFPEHLHVEFINITEEQGLEQGREIGLVMIPMQALLNPEGRVVFKHVGYISTGDLKEQINGYLPLK